MKRFFRGVLTTFLTFITVILLTASLLFGYLALTGRAALFGYTFSLIETEEKATFVLLRTDMPELSPEDTVLHREADGSLRYVSVAYASDAVVYYYDQTEKLCSVPLTSPEFAGKLLWENDTIGGMLSYVSGEPGRWVVLGCAGGLLLLSFTLLIISAAHRNRALREADKKANDEELLNTFTPEEVEFELPAESAEDVPEEKKTETKTYKQETVSLDLNELRKRMAEGEQSEKEEEQK